jgi:predicted DNA-binding transcriptional regulator YafY
MPKSENQKLKLLYIADMLRKETDENHGVTVPDIISMLEKNNITAERKSIYSDIRALQDYGLDIEMTRENGCRYKLLSREFDLAELKLLVDAVQSSKFITAKKTRGLIEKITALASGFEAQELTRDVKVLNRIKSENENIFYTVDGIFSAINNNCDITFKYYEWTPQRKKVERKNGMLYRVSPWALIRDDENYYLAAYDAEADIIKHFRVDKMQSVTVLEGVKRLGEKIYKEKEKSGYYSRGLFSMYHGEEETVTLRCDNTLAGVIIDRFGRDIIMAPSEDGYFTVMVKVAVSDLFFGWVSNFGSKMKITAPSGVADAYKAHIESILAQYK